MAPEQSLKNFLNTSIVTTFELLNLFREEKPPHSSLALYEVVSAIKVFPSLKITFPPYAAVLEK